MGCESRHHPMRDLGKRSTPSRVPCFLSQACRCSREPGLHPAQPFFEIGGGESEAETNKVATVNRIEIDPGRSRDAGVAQQRLAERETVVGEMPDAGVDVKRAVGWSDDVQRSVLVDWPSCRELWECRKIRRGGEDTAFRV